MAVAALGLAAPGALALARPAAASAPAVPRDPVAAVDDPAGDAAPYHRVFPLFRSANMASPDRLSSGVGFHSFRIPAVVTTATGRVLAFAEGRRHTNRDFGDINLVYCSGRIGLPGWRS